MLNREVREWLEKVKCGSYSYDDAIRRFTELARFLTFDEIKLLKSKLEDSYSNKM